MAHLPKCDKIVVVDDGKIIEMGTYDELLAKNGKLKEIVESQKDTPDGEIITISFRVILTNKFTICAFCVKRTSKNQTGTAKKHLEEKNH